MDFDRLMNLVVSGGVPVWADSRAVREGDVFAAVRGTANDGHHFIAEAVKNGARYIVAECRVQCEGAELVIVPDSAKAWGLLAQAAKGNPASKLTNLAVTGTNGKTTTAFLVQSIIATAGQKCGLIGTIIVDTGRGAVESSMTTPDATAMANMTAEMVANGIKYMMIEASSHALAQSRLAGINFAAAAFTNLTGDHLDYHKDMDNYLAAKMILFENLSPDSAAILNKQSPQSSAIAAATKSKVMYYAVNEPADIYADVISMDANETVYEFHWQGKKQRVHSPLLGMHNISNHLAAVGLCLAAGIDLLTVVKGLENLKIVPGRLEAVRCGQDFAVLVDYAHTDDALQNVLTTLKPLCKGKLTVVFGCGGDRDKTKRPRMARVCRQLADRIIITSDNPRTENPLAIIDDILTGLEPPKADNIFVDPDRKKAIGLAMEMAKKNDIVLIAGKGHENYQIIGKKKRHFSDSEVAEEFLIKRGI